MNSYIHYLIILRNNIVESINAMYRFVELQEEEKN